MKTSLKQQQKQEVLTKENEKILEEKIRGQIWGKIKQFADDGKGWKEWMELKKILHRNDIKDRRIRRPVID